MDNRPNRPSRLSDTDNRPAAGFDSILLFVAACWVITLVATL